MADQLYFIRDTKVLIEIGSVIWEVPVLDGFSFSQATNASEVTLAEMSGTDGSSRRGRRMFTDSFAPAEWSFSTYMRPFTSTGTGTGAASGVDGDHHAVEEVLWALMAGAAHYQGNEFKNKAGGTAYISHSKDVGATPGSADIDFGQSNTSTLGTANIYFVLDDSGSMQWEVMPDDYVYVNGTIQGYLFPIPSNMYDGLNHFDKRIPTFADDNIHNVIKRSSAVNKVFYNPLSDYTPWKSWEDKMTYRADFSL